MTRQQAATLRFIKAYWLEYGFSPSLQDIAGGLGITKTPAFNHVHALINGGELIVTHPKRGLCIPQSKTALPVEFPPGMRRQIDVLATNAATTAEAVVIECVRDRLALLDRADFVVVKQQNGVLAQSRSAS